jgi:hypothetical protein
MVWDLVIGISLGFHHLDVGFASSVPALTIEAGAISFAWAVIAERPCL